MAFKKIWFTDFWNLPVMPFMLRKNSMYFWHCSHDWRIPRIFSKRHLIYYVLVLSCTSTSISIPGVSLSVGRNDPQRQEKGQYQSFSSFIFSRECIGSPQVSGCPALTRPVMPRLQACCTQSPRHYQPFVSYDCQKS